MEVLIGNSTSVKGYHTQEHRQAIPNLYYKKRIQIVVFDLKNISNFEPFLKEQKTKII